MVPVMLTVVGPVGIYVGYIIQFLYNALYGFSPVLGLSLIHILFYFKGRKTKSYKKSLSCFGVYVVLNAIRLVLENYM